MNAYFIGMLVTMVAYIVIGGLISRGVKDANDYFVAGRRAPAFLIVGSLVASYCSTGLYFGDAGEAYSGIFTALITLGTMQTVGYILGGVFFGRYLRRSGVNTIPEFFGKRFCSPAVKKLAAVTELLTILVYLLSTMQGIGTLMGLVTGVDYRLCIFLALVTFTVLTVTSGSKGVLITDTIMFGLFTSITLVVIILATNAGGGWFNVMERLAGSRPQLFSWGGDPTYLYPTGAQNVVWSLAYGIVWMGVCMVGPWQAGRYLMAKNEHVVIRSSVWAALFVFLLEFMVECGAGLMNVFEPEMESASHIYVWVSLNLMPTILGVIMLTGILAAGISSATTFLSIIGSAVANDLLVIEDDKKKVRVGRITIVAAAAVEMLLAYYNPPQVFWIMFLGATVVACSWLPVSIASIWSKHITKAGAFWGMLAGFVGCGAMKIYTSVSGVSLPVYLDSFFVGLFTGIVALVIASACTKVTAAELLEREKLFVMPETEKDPAEIKRTRRAVALSIPLGAVVTAVLLVFWVVPYLRGLQ